MNFETKVNDIINKSLEKIGEKTPERREKFDNFQTFGAKSLYVSEVKNNSSVLTAVHHRPFEK